MSAMNLNIAQIAILIEAWAKETNRDPQEVIGDLFEYFADQETTELINKLESMAGLETTKN